MRFMPSDTSHYTLRKRYPSEGYTLIEVIVAMAIFSAMMMLGGVALNQGLKHYQGLAEKGLGFWEYARPLWMEKSANSMVDYYVYTRSDEWFPYFRGDQERISYVSLAPLAGEYPVVVWIKNEAQEDGRRSLVYYELPVYTKSFEEIERENIFSDYKKGKSMKLQEGAEGVEFSFYGYDLRERKFLWSSQFEGNRRKLLPSSILITSTQNGRKDRMVLKVNVNSLSKMVYHEIYRKP